jgi:hypothetical protein
MKESDFDGLAGLMADIIIRNREAGEDVKKLRENFLVMQYCLPRDQAVPLASRLIASVIPDGEFLDLFIANLQGTVKGE